MKINQTPHVIFQAKSPFSLKFCITLHYHDTTPVTFLAEMCSNESAQFLIPFLKPQGQSLLKFHITVSIMKDNSTVFF